MLCGYYYTGLSSTKLSLYAASGSGSWDLANGELICDLPTVGAWEHHALVRSGSDWSYYVDGSRTYNSSLGSSTLYSQSTPSYITLGKSWGTDASPEAYYDDFRVTQGLARYSGTSFTPPSTAHLTSAGDVNKQIVVNSDADGVAVGTGGINQARIAKAWVHFDGTEAAADMIGASYNVSSITDIDTGRYTINFATALTDANYSAVMYTNAYDGDAAGGFLNHFAGGLNTRTTTSIRLESYSSAAYPDASLCDVIIFGN